MYSAVKLINEWETNILALIFRVTEYIYCEINIIFVYDKNEIKLQHQFTLLFNIIALNMYKLAITRK